MSIAYCIGCGCNDYHACIEEDGTPCCWLVVDYEVGRGVCSCCSEHLDRWDANDREIAAQAALEAIEDFGHKQETERDRMNSRIYKLRLEDKGQDFKTLYVQGGVIIHVEPQVGRVWCGKELSALEFAPQDQLSLKGGPRLNYGVESVEIYEVVATLAREEVEA